MRGKIITYAKCTPYKLPMLISLHGDIQLISVQGEPCSIQLSHWSVESDDKSVVLTPKYATQPKNGFVEISGKGLIYKGIPSASAPDTFRVDLEDGLKTVRREVVVAIMPNGHSQAAGGRE